MQDGVFQVRRDGRREQDAVEAMSRLEATFKIEKALHQSLKAVMVSKAF